jgi:hypothetical protein
MVFRGRRLLRNVFAALALLAITAFAGCGAGDGRRALEGRVELDGKALAAATISFQPLPGNPGGTSGAMTDDDGRFSISAAKGLVPGKYLATIQKWKGTGRTFKDPHTGESREITAPIAFQQPPRQEVSIGETGPNQLEFRLTSAK